ncbi:MAG: nucleotidyltransferase domain-containing protein [Janthinobacterium lividum]
MKKNLTNTSYRAFVFGSQANLLELRRADIDLGLMAEDPLSTQQLSKINAEIEELPMLYNIDVVDFQTVDQQFKDVAMKNIEWL